MAAALLQVCVTLIVIVAGVPRVRPQDINGLSSRVDSSVDLTSTSVLNATATATSNPSRPGSVDPRPVKNEVPTPQMPQAVTSTTAEATSINPVPPVTLAQATEKNSSNVASLQSSAPDVAPTNATEQGARPLKVTVVQPEDSTMNSSVPVSADALARTPLPLSKTPGDQSDEASLYRPQDIDYDEAPLHRPLEIENYERLPIFKPQDQDDSDEAPLYGSQEILQLDEVVRQADSRLYPDIIPLSPTEVPTVQGEKNTKTRLAYDDRDGDPWDDWVDPEDTGVRRHDGKHFQIHCPLGNSCLVC